MDKDTLAMADSVERLVAQIKALELEMYCHDQIVRALTHDGFAPYYPEAATPAEVLDEPNVPSCSIATRTYLLLLGDNNAVPAPSSHG